jgi:hypothetical protein
MPSDRIYTRFSMAIPAGGFDDYRARMARDISVFVLEPR